MNRMEGTGGTEVRGLRSEDSKRRDRGLKAGMIRMIRFAKDGNGRRQKRDGWMRRDTGIKTDVGMLEQYGLNAKGGVVYEDVEAGVC